MLKTVTELAHRVVFSSNALLLKKLAVLGNEKKKQTFGGGTVSLWPRSDPSAKYIIWKHRYSEEQEDSILENTCEQSQEASMETTCIFATLKANSQHNLYT